MNDDPELIAWLPELNNDSTPEEPFAVFAQQTHHGRFYFLTLSGEILATLRSSHAAELVKSIGADLEKNSDVAPEDMADAIRYEDSRITIRSGFDEGGDQVFSVDTRGHLPYCYALGLLEAAKDTIKETYVEPDEEEEYEEDDE